MRMLIFIFLLSTLFLASALSLEVIKDNDGGAPAYTETGVWNTSGSTGYNGGTYRYASAGGGNTATWTAGLGAGDAEVSVIYRAGANRVLIINGLSEDSDTNHFDWNTLSMEEGIYWIYALIDDGVNSPVVSYSPGSVIISRITEQEFRSHLLGIEAIPPERHPFSDFNKDGVLDIADLIALIDR